MCLTLSHPIIFGNVIPIYSQEGRDLRLGHLISKYLEKIQKLIQCQINVTIQLFH